MIFDKCHDIRNQHAPPFMRFILAKLWNVLQNVNINFRRAAEGKRKDYTGERIKFWYANGLAFNSIRIIKRRKKVRGCSLKQPAVKHMKTLDNFVIIFYFLDHFRFYLFESIFPLTSFMLAEKMCGATVWCIYINLNTARSRLPPFRPFFGALLDGLFMSFSIRIFYCMPLWFPFVLSSKTQEEHP